MKRISSVYILVFLVAALCATDAEAQRFNVGADIVSRYVWRGTDFGESVSIQPTLSFSAGGFEAGTWASYAASPQSAAFNEHDLWIGYVLETARSGSFSIGVFDYYFPAPPGDGLPRDPDTEFFNFDGDGRGAHWIEPYVGYAGPEAFPVTFMAAIMAHNDPDNSVYLEAGYPFRIDGTELGLTLGMVPMASSFYGTSGVSVINMELSAARTIPITDTFGIPVSVGYVLNPLTERSFLVFGISLF